MRDKGCSYTANWNWIIISLIAFVVLALLVLYVSGTRVFDQNLLDGVRRFLSPYPKSIAKEISDFGRYRYMLWPLIAACAVLISHHKYMPAFLLVIFTKGAYLLNTVLKDFIGRERPCTDYPGFSFPSCHATVTMCFYGILIYLVLRYVSSTFWRYFLVSVFSIFIFLNCISRLWLGVHYPTDVIAGCFLGVILINLYVILAKFFSKV